MLETPERSGASGGRRPRVVAFVLALLVGSTETHAADH